MSDVAIRIEGLTRDFATVRAVDNLSLEVPAGAVFGFLGPNGAGKTTTIRMLLGLLEPTDGRAEVLGFDICTHGQEVRTRTGALLEHSGVYDRLTAEENLQLYARISRLSEGDGQNRIKQLLTHMGLWERRKELAGRWSRGMRQKLALCRALLHRPRLVFLDEPTAGLDVIAATALRDDLDSLAAREGVTIFLTTHNMTEAERLCDQVAVIREGGLVAVDHPDRLRARAGGSRIEITGDGFRDEAMDDVQRRPEVTSAEVRDGRLTIHVADEAPAAPLVSLLVHAGVQVEEVHRSAASLEDVFLSLMEGQQ